ncbi:MAG: type II toxin-antitoxin system VapC family toxin [Acidobacteria bacterium]|nr:type II toxin-antitoxin system VapC family toxin [Acidobacteriota bacterium]MCI0627831.1 type II toxin-antitoxin system VapC family toxin [Acidobacteriota bacterium]MCI0721238.1 type II toxin-antitoxin system VapC family toxin [Acidobacteriota bacterium]
MIVVLDASVALKWSFTDEEAASEAVALLDDFVEGRVNLIAPTLFTYEIVSAIHVAINRRRIKESDGISAIRSIMGLEIGLRAFEDLVDETFRLSRRYSLSPYDGAYLALASKAQAEFLTGDRRLFNAISKRISWIRWIGDYQPA